MPDMTKKSFVTLVDSEERWEQIVGSILQDSAHIIALRGAGSFNGISIPDAERLLETQLIPRIEKFIIDGYVTVIYDGDNDDRAYPDIGYIMGRIREHFGDRIDCYAVQVWSWYRYSNELPGMRALHSAHGGEYRTVLFPDNTYPGNHDHFSQHVRLVRSPGYEQWYVGACGLIASKQLADYSTKLSGAAGTHRATIFRLPVSAEQEIKIRRKIIETTDDAKRTRLIESLERRQGNPYGLLCSPVGEFIKLPEYGNLQIEVL